MIKNFYFFLRNKKPNISNPNCWGLIGGEVEDGENFEKALKREIKEEINLDLNNFLEIGKIVNSKSRQIKIYFKEISEDEKKENKIR